MGAVSLYTGGLLFMASVAHFTLSAPVYEDEHALQTQEQSGEVKGCYYNFEHYDEGDRILTNEPCLNCTCHNRMLMCYLRVCPFTKAIGQDCKVEKRPDQCCPVITCPQVPVALLTSSTTEVPPTTTALGRPDNYGCTLDDNKFYADGAQVPSDPKKPCELCYCIRNHTACVMQECTLNVEGCRPVYQDGICCPVRYDCDYDDVLTTPKPTVGLITTPGGPAECRVNDTIYFDGEMIDNMTANPCEHCYCMRGEVVCAVQECGTPLQDSDCHALPAESGQCCPSTYECANGTIPAQSTPAQPTSESLSQEEDGKLDEEVPKVTEANVEVTSEKASEVEQSASVASDVADIEPIKEEEVANPVNDAEPQSTSFDEVSDNKDEITTPAPEKPSEEAEEPKPSQPDGPLETTPSGQYTEISVENVEINTAPPSISHETTVQPSSHDNQEQPIASDDDQSFPDEVKPTEELSNQQEGDRQTETTTVVGESAVAEPTTVKIEEVEKEEESRIPGEGSCLVSGKTYAPDTAVPVTDKCQKSCKCVNSIVVCEEIECPALPPNAEGCRPVRTSDSCCPNYFECDQKPSDLPETQDQVISTKRPDVIVGVDITTEGQEAVDRIDITTSAPFYSVSEDPREPVVFGGISPENLLPGTDDISLTSEEPEKNTELSSTVPPESTQQGSSGENLSPEAIHNEPAIHDGSVDNLEEKPVITSDESGVTLDDKVEEQPSVVDHEESQQGGSSEAGSGYEGTTQSGGYDENKGPESGDFVSITTAAPEYQSNEGGVSVTEEPVQHGSIELTTKAQEVEETGLTEGPQEVEKVPDVSITTEGQVEQEISITTEAPVQEVESPTSQPSEDSSSPVPPTHELDSIAASSEDAVHSENQASEITSEPSQESEKIEESPKVTTEAPEGLAEQVNTTPQPEAAQEQEPSSSEANVIPHDEIPNVEPSHDESPEQSPEEETVSVTTSSPLEEQTSAPVVPEVSSDVVPAVSEDETSQSSEVSNEILEESKPEEAADKDSSASSEEAVATTEPPVESVSTETSPDAAVVSEVEPSGNSEQVQETTLSPSSEEKPEPEQDQVVEVVEPALEEQTGVQTPQVLDQVQQEPDLPAPELVVTTVAPEEPVQPEAQPEAQPAETVQPEAQPPETVQPEAQPAETVQPEAQPAETVQPEAQPAETVQPEAQPAETVQPEVQPTESVQTDAQPTDPVQPEAQPAEPVQPDAQPDESAQPEIQPVAQTEKTTEEILQTEAPFEDSPSSENPPVETPAAELPHIEEEAQPEASSENTPQPEETVQPETSQDVVQPEPSVPEEIPPSETPQETVEEQKLPEITTSQQQEPSEAPIVTQPEEPKPEETPEVITTQHPVEVEPVTQVGPSRPLETLSIENQLSGLTEKPESVPVETPTEGTQPEPSSTEQPVVDEKVETVKEDEPVVVQTPSEIVPALENVQEEVVNTSEVEPTHVPEAEGIIPVSTDAPNLIPGEDLSGGAIKPVEAEIPSVPVPSEEPLPGVELPSANVVNEETSKPVEEVTPEQPEQPQAQPESEVSDKAPEEQQEVTQEPAISSSSAPLEEHSVSSTPEPIQSSTDGGFNPGSSFFQQWTPKPFEPQSTSEAPHQPEDSHYPSGFEPEYEDDDGVSYGPGTCRYGGKVYLSAQQIPRDDPCDFCFCFRSDIICLQQSCPPPIKGCYQETIKGFCCPRYECHVSMATTLNLTTTTTTTTTTLPPLFFAHAYKGAATKAGCQVNGVAYNVGDRIASTSGPCLSCRCGANGQMRCDPTVCGPQETLLRQVMDAASVARRR